MKKAFLITQFFKVLVRHCNFFASNFHLYIMFFACSNIGVKFTPYIWIYGMNFTPYIILYVSEAVQRTAVGQQWSCQGLFLPCVGDGLPADRRDELDGELLLLRIDVALV